MVKKLLDGAKEINGSDIFPDIYVIRKYIIKFLHLIGSSNQTHYKIDTKIARFLSHKNGYSQKELIMLKNYDLSFEKPSEDDEDDGECYGCSYCCDGSSDLSEFLLHEPEITMWTKHSSEVNSDYDALEFHQKRPKVNLMKHKIKEQQFKNKHQLKRQQLKKKVKTGFNIKKSNKKINKQLQEFVSEYFSV